LKNGVGDIAEVVKGESEVGGGSFPGVKLPTWLVTIRYPVPDTLVARLRGGTPPVIARISGDRVVLDPRTILPNQIDTSARAIAAALTADS
jgi:L-seryl-tRNA(Ser) seleniumtransferase